MHTMRCALQRIGSLCHILGWAGLSACISTHSDPLLPPPPLPPHHTIAALMFCRGFSIQVGEELEDIPCAALDLFDAGVEQPWFGMFSPYALSEMARDVGCERPPNGWPQHVALVGWDDDKLQALVGKLSSHSK